MAEVLGNFEQAVLLALARPKTSAGKEAYGRALFKEVQVRLGREISAGAVYATLNRLEDKGLISSEVRDGDEARRGVPRRYYRVEPDGVRALNEAKAAADRLWADVRHPLKVTT